MTRSRSGRSTVVFACVLIAVALAVLTSLVLAAVRDDGARPWTGRLFGLATGAAAVAVGAAMIRRAGEGKPHYWGMVGALALGALLTGANSHKPEAPPASRSVEAIPMRIERWHGTPLEEKPETRRKTEEILGTKDIVMRRYTRPGERYVDLAIIHAESNRKVAHPPEQCYTAAGNELLDTGTETLTVGGGRRLQAQRLVLMGKPRAEASGEAVSAHEPGGMFAVLYWYRAGDLNTPSFLRQQLYVILSNLNPFKPRGIRVALIRLSTPIQNRGETDAAVARMAELARSLFPHIEKNL